ncbi:hydrogenase maturation protease [Hankyongella ginsenosidimutans]|uniref:Hydrogenase maturation protease n=2 Tax=Hankyongella ginsenosidimutans TaxID=1763828 RepID=A0A4D7C5Z4_9SPHN|nr:hydrogenase maturation protease [Hankyongella ginsenosidimutans]
MADMSGPAVAVIGCGNPLRGDDGAGPAVIARLARMGLPENVGLFDAGTDGMAVMYRARGAQRLIIIDAREPEGAPGAVFEVPGDALEAEPTHGVGLHAFRWDHALFVGRKIYRETFPKMVEVYLIEAGSLDYATGLSASVAKAADLVAERIAARLAVADTR